MLYLSFKFVLKFNFCVSPLVKRYPGALQRSSLNKTTLETDKNGLYKDSVCIATPKYNYIRCLG